MKAIVKPLRCVHFSISPSLSCTSPATTNMHIQIKWACYVFSHGHRTAARRICMLFWSSHIMPQAESKRTRDQRVALESKDRIVAKLREQLQSFSRRPGSRAGSSMAQLGGASMGGSTRLPGVNGGGGGSSESRPDSAPYL